jgi:hypothetical protein
MQTTTRYEKKVRERTEGTFREVRGKKIKITVDY